MIVLDEAPESFNLLAQWLFNAEGTDTFLVTKSISKCSTRVKNTGNVASLFRLSDKYEIQDLKASVEVRIRVDMN